MGTACSRRQEIEVRTRGMHVSPRWVTRELRSGCVAAPLAECLVLWICVPLPCDRHRPSCVHPYRAGVPAIGRICCFPFRSISIVDTFNTLHQTRRARYTQRLSPLERMAQWGARPRRSRTFAQGRRLGLPVRTAPHARCSRSRRGSRARPKQPPRSSFRRTQRCC